MFRNLTAIAGQLWNALNDRVFAAFFALLGTATVGGLIAMWVYTANDSLMGSPTGMLFRSLMTVGFLAIAVFIFRLAAECLNPTFALGPWFLVCGLLLVIGVGGGIGLMMYSESDNPGAFALRLYSRQPAVLPDDINNLEREDISGTRFMVAAGTVLDDRLGDRVLDEATECYGFEGAYDEKKDPRSWWIVAICPQGRGRITMTDLDFYRARGVTAFVPATVPTAAPVHAATTPPAATPSPDYRRPTHTCYTGELPANAFNGAFAGYATGQPVCLYRTGVSLLAMAEGTGAFSRYVPILDETVLVLADGTQLNNRSVEDWSERTGTDYVGIAPARLDAARLQRNGGDASPTTIPALPTSWPMVVRGVAPNNLNCRAEPSRDAIRIAGLPERTVVMMVEKSEDGLWIGLDLDDGDGAPATDCWVFAAYLTTFGE
jgi:hypothetical protein